MGKHTPMMKQYLRIKAEHQDAFLFFRLGDFYELFYEDAIKAAKELEITLTKRDSGQQEPIPMCGVPHHSAESYIKNLVDKGYKVAICEQVEDPKEAKGVVKREVVQVITPGTVMESAMLEERESNYIASLTHIDKDQYAIVYHDLSTGESQLARVDGGWEMVLHELANQSIKEVVISETLPKAFQDDLKEQLQITLSYEEKDSMSESYHSLVETLEDKNSKKAFGRLLNYLIETQKRSLDHLQPVQEIELKNYLSLDRYSKRNLELTETIMQQGRHGSLLWVLDETVTSMGARLLKKWLDRPLLQQSHIEQRLNIVEGLYREFMERELLREALQSVYDLERLAGRIAFGNVNARDLIQLQKSLESIPKIKEILENFREKEFQQLNHSLTYPKELVQLLQESIMDDPPISITEGSIIRDGFHEKLDEYRTAIKYGKEWIASLEQEEREKTNIRSLKIGYNKIFGYYIEVTNPNLHLVPKDRYERKQTLANSERFITPELKEKEQLILEAEENSVDLEYELFIQIRETIKKEIPLIQQLAQVISKIDVLQSFATVSEQNNYTRPIFSRDQLKIRQSRHPVIEKVMKDDPFVPNDITLSDQKRMLLITGPNMSGKSTYMRQLALTIIMAQIGCFVPAEEAQLLIFDQIFTRIGAADDLVAGQSTFMVEMLEAKHAIEKATDQSLILLDEIGRGTSTYDGMSLAQAIIEYIHDYIHAKTLFSTHYHELTSLEESLEYLVNIHVRAEEVEGKVVFLYQVEEGAADQSYGIHVAKLADLPDELIHRATEILKQFEEKEQANIPTNDINTGQLSLFPESVNDHEQKKNTIHSEKEEILKELKQLNVLEMTPLEAMNTLYRLQKKIKKIKGGIL